MANHNMMTGHNQDILLRQNQYLEVGHIHSSVLDHSHNFAFACINDQNSNMVLGDDYVPDLGLGHSDGHGLAVNETIQHDLAQHEENGLGFNRDVDPDADQDHANADDHENQLTYTAQDHTLGLAPGNHELAVVEHNGFHENSSSAKCRDEEMGIVPALDMRVLHPHVVKDPPILQHLALPGPSLELKVGQEFPDLHSCRRALREAAIAFHFEMQTIKSDKTRFTAKCARDGCPWRIRAAKLPGVPTFAIRTIHEEHTCGGLTHLGHQQASVQWVADSMEQHLRENPLCKPKEILEEIHRVHGISLSYKQAWRAKERFKATVRGSFEEEYRLLPQYCHHVERTNPGSIAVVYGNPVDSCFQRLFISFQASIFGFLNACCPLIALNRFLLKSKHLGTMLLATGFDGDGAMFPLAFGVVDDENNENWMWFLSELHNLLETNTENMPRLTILSDRQKGIVDGIEVNFPTAFHGFCMHHLIDNFRKEFNNTMLVNLLWEAANALTTIEFEQKILEIEEGSQEAAYWIRHIDPRLWATAYFEGTRFGHLTANTVGTLDNLILEASELPIIQMMECIRRQLMTWFNDRRETSLQWTSILVPSAERQVSEAMEHAHSYQVLKADDAQYEVISDVGSHMVNICSRHCACCGWQLCGMPCAHAVAALISCRQNVYRFAESCFTVANYRKVYSQSLHPIPDKAHWREMSEGFQTQGYEIVINPPVSIQPLPGRPRKRQARVEDGGGRMKRTVHCSRCKQTGHFRTTCTVPV